MDLKRLRTFVTVADLGTVSKAALRLRISQSALSRQIADLEYECGFKLFDRIGRRLFLTTRGEQLLGRLPRRAGPDRIARRAHRAAQARRFRRAQARRAAADNRERARRNSCRATLKSFPNVRVKLTEALGMDQVPLLERGEVHIGIRHDQGVNPWFESFALPSDDVLAACARSLPLGRQRHDRHRVACVPSAAAAQTPATRFAGCSTRPAAWPTSSPIFCSRAARRTHCSRSLKPSRGLRSFRRCCEPIATGSRSRAITHRRKPLRDRYVIQWDKRRPMPSYAENFCAALAAYMREVLPITRPSSK